MMSASPGLSPVGACSVIAAPTTSSGREMSSTGWDDGTPSGSGQQTEPEIGGIEHVQVDMDIRRAGTFVERLLQLVDAVHTEAGLAEVLTFAGAAGPDTGQNHLCWSQCLYRRQESRPVSEQRAYDHAVERARR
jgi:hypothetical protein